MNIKQAAQVIRDSVTMDQILSLYGYRTKHGFMCCPFHGEKAPSLKVYQKTGGWHCFGCGKGGSVIDFVMEQECCDFRTAVHGIDNALHMGLMAPDEDAMEAMEARRIQDWLDSFVKKVNDYLDELRACIEKEQQMALIMVRTLEEKRSKDVQSVTADEWTTILKWKDEDDYFDYRKDKVEELREEVAAWRRKARKTG